MRMHVSGVERRSALAAPLHAQRPGGRDRDKGRKERGGSDAHVVGSESTRGFGKHKKKSRENEIRESGRREGRREVSKQRAASAIYGAWP
jgi:hypothetical protein